MTVRLVYTSLTGNTERFIHKIAKLRPDWQIIKITPDLLMKEPYHLVIYTIGHGVVPESVKDFLDKNSQLMLSVSSSGNTNYGPAFAIAAMKVSQTHGVPPLLRFEQAGGPRDVEMIIKRIEEISCQ